MDPAFSDFIIEESRQAALEAVDDLPPWELQPILLRLAETHPGDVLAAIEWRAR